MNVDPVVGHHFLAINHQADNQKVPIPEPVGSPANLFGGGWVKRINQLSYWHRTDKVRAIEPLNTIGSMSLQTDHTVFAVNNPRDRLLQEYRISVLAKAIGHHLPHLSRPALWVMETVDEGFDGSFLLFEKSIADRGGQR